MSTDNIQSWPFRFDEGREITIVGYPPEDMSIHQGLHSLHVDLPIGDHVFRSGGMVKTTLFRGYKKSAPKVVIVIDGRGSVVCTVDGTVVPLPYPPQIVQFSEPIVVTEGG